MALTHAIGFELNTLTNGVETQSWTTTNNGGLSIQTSTVHTGTYALKVNPPTSTGGDGIRVQNSNSHGIYNKFSLNIATRPTGTDTSIWLISDSTDGIAIAYIAIETSGALALAYSDTGGGFTQLGSNSAVLSLNSWNYVEVYADDTAGLANTVLTAKLNGTTFATGTVAIFPTGNGGIPNGFSTVGDQLVGANSTGTWYVDDWVINDISGSAMNSFAGNINLIRLTPGAAGDVNTFATQTGGTAGAANNFTRVDEVTPDDATTFNGSSTLNQEDLFNCNDPAIQTYDTVNFVEVMGRFRNSTADATGTAKLEIEKTSGGTIAQGAAITPNTTTWVTSTPARALITYTDPDGAAWTVTTLASAQIGYKLTTAPGTAGRRIDMTSVWGYVGYTPGTPPITTTGGTMTLLGVG